MPIVGLTTKTEFGAGLPLIARLYKGEEKPEGSNRPGKDLDYFRVEFEPQFADLLPIWQEMYGNEPDEFGRVFLAASTVDEAFSSWKEEWTATTMLHRCDGEYQKNWYNAAAQMYSTAKIACASKDEHPCGCKAVGRLNLILPDFIEAVGVLGYVSISTHSLNDILTVYRYLADIERIAGKLTGVPFVFGRAAREISAPKQVKKNGAYVNEGRIKVNKSLFYLHVASDFTQQHLLPILSGLQQPTQPQLPAPKLDVQTAKNKLGQNTGIARRLGQSSDGFVTEVENAILENELAQIAIVDPLPPSEVVETPKNAVDPLPASNSVQFDSVIKNKKAYVEADLWNAVLKTCYGNEPFKMKPALKALHESGALNVYMTLEEAVEVVKKSVADAALKEAG